MKKTFLFSLGLIVAFSVMFISCDDNPGNNLGENTGIPCEINIVASEGGDVQFSDYFGTSKHVYTGSKVTVIATADEGYAFIGWYVVGKNEKLVSDNASYTFVTQGDLQLVAKFGKLQDVAIDSSDGGSASFKDSEEKIVHLLPGEEVTVIAVPDENTDFLGWFIGDSNEPVSTEATYTFAVSENVSLVAKFNQWPLVSISSGANGSVSFENSAETSLFVQPGEDVTVVAVPDENTDFLGWFIGDSNEPVSTEATYTFTVEENWQLVAKFNKWPLVSIRSGGYGTVSFENSSDLSQYIQPGEEVTVVATPAANCDFLGWFVGNSNESVSTEATYTFTVSENVSLVAKFKKQVNYNGYEYVDLGLPSGAMWAAYNVGATKPEEYGGYYAWGETEEKEDYSWETYKWCNGSYNTMTKYCTDSSYGTVDNKTVLDLEDDVAHVKWGGDWRMPTTEEQRELLNNCTWEWTALNGVNGYRVTGPNGNSIFLPAADYRGGADVYGRGYFGNYWSGSLYSNYSYSAYVLYFYDSFYFGWGKNYRYSGYSVRPVIE